MRMVLTAPFEILFTTTGLFRLAAFSTMIVGFFVGLAYLCYQFLAVIAGQFDNVFWSDNNWMEFIGYVLNFGLLYRFFLFYYFIFCGFVISFIVTYCLELSSRVIPEAIEIFQAALRHITGE